MNHKVLFLAVVLTLQANVHSVDWTHRSSSLKEDDSIVIRAMNKRELITSDKLSQLDRIPSWEFLCILSVPKAALQMDKVELLMPRPLLECNEEIIVKTIRELVKLSDSEIDSMISTIVVPRRELWGASATAQRQELTLERYRKAVMLLSAKYDFGDVYLPMWISKDSKTIALRKPTRTNVPKHNGGIYDLEELWKYIKGKNYPHRTENVILVSDP